MEDNITAAIRKLVREEVAAILRRTRVTTVVVDPRRIYSVASAAELLGVSTDYVYSRVKDGSITRLVDLGGSKAKYRIRADALQAFIDSRTMQDQKHGI